MATTKGYRFIAMYNVWLSTAHDDPPGYVDVVAAELLNQGMQPLAVNWSLSGSEMLANCLGKMQSVDAFVALISSYRYGPIIYDPVLNPYGLSISELQFDIAVSRAIPLAAFLMDDKVPVPVERLGTEVHASPKLNAFRKNVINNSTVCIVFRSPGDLKARAPAVLTLLNDELDTRKTPIIRVSRYDLANAASPAPLLSPDGLLDAGPNAVYDSPTTDADLPTLPIRQRALISTILSDLPGNAPRHLKSSLISYDDELRARGVQPILGLLKDMAAIIESAAGATNAAREWLEEGMHTAFVLFAQNHALFVQRFPLDPKREELYAQTHVDEPNASGPTVARPFEEVAEAAHRANAAGLTTDDFVRIVDKMSEFAKVISSLPTVNLADVQDSGHIAGRSEEHPENSTPNTVSPKKRMILSGFGFLERAYNLLGSTATLAGPVEGNLLLIALRLALSKLEKFIGLG